MEAIFKACEFTCNFYTGCNYDKYIPISLYEDKFRIFLHEISSIDLQICCRYHISN